MPSIHSYEYVNPWLPASQPASQLPASGLPSRPFLTKTEDVRTSGQTEEERGGLDRQTERERESENFIDPCSLVQARVSQLEGLLTRKGKKKGRRPAADDDDSSTMWRN